MRLCELTVDQYNIEYPSGTIKSTLQYVEKNCSDFIADMKSAQKFLYRGIHGIDSEEYYAFTMNTPENRNPRGMSLGQQEVFDNLISSQGFTALRHNSISCNPALNFVKRWGAIFFIFPHNGYSYTWSPKIHDFGGDWNLGEELTELEDQGFWDKQRVNQYPEIVKKFVTTMDLKNNKEMPAALRNFNEISIHGRYTAIRVDLYSKAVYEYFGIK